MFMTEIDWNDPKFSKWKLSNLGSLSKAQKEAIWDDDEIDNPPITESEQIQLCKQFDCKVNLGRFNVCYGVERDWPRKYFKSTDFKTLPRLHQIQLQKTMVKNAVNLYNKYNDPERMKSHIKRHNEKVLAPFLEERRCRFRFNRIKKIGDNEKINDSTDLSLFEENAQIPEISDNKGSRSDIQKRITRSANISRHEINPNLKNETASNRRTAKTGPRFTSNQKELPSTSKGITPDRRVTRSTHNSFKEVKIEMESKIIFKSPSRSSNVTPKRPLTGSATRNKLINESRTLRRQKMDRSTDNQKSSRKNVSSEMVAATLPRRSSRIRNNRSSDAEETFFSFTSNESNQTTTNSHYTRNEISSFMLDTSSFDSSQRSLNISTPNIGTPTAYRQPSNTNVTNSTPDLVIDETVFHLSLTNSTEDFIVIDGRQTSTQI